MWSPEIDTTHLRAGRWECPFCDASKEIVQTADCINRTLMTSLYSHARITSDIDHGGLHALPDGYSRDDLSAYITFNRVLANEHSHHVES